LVLAQAQARFQLPVHQLDCPTLLVLRIDTLNRKALANQR
jgi:regulator of sirC expression with transglutaminase-like and TPR domain